MQVDELCATEEGICNQIVPNDPMNIDCVVNPVKNYQTSSKPYSPAKKWKWAKFCPNSDPSFSLKHWIKEEDYLFLNDYYHYRLYNEPVQEIPIYSNEEYELYLKDENWSRHETDYLIKLADLYNCNFVLMHDRYAFGGAESDDVKPRRTVEEIKKKYNDICKKVPKFNYLFDAKYDPDEDHKRKRHIQEILDNSDYFLNEEKPIMDEIQNFIENFDQFVSERQSIISRFAGDLQVFVDGLVQSDQFSQTSHDSTKKAINKSKKHSSKRSLSKLNDDSSLRAQSYDDNTFSRSHSFLKSPRSAFLSSPIEGLIVPKKEKTVIGPHLRSTRLKPVRTGLTKHVEKVMSEFGLGHRPTISSLDVVKLYDEIRSLIMALIDIRKAADKTEQEIKHLSCYSSKYPSGRTSLDNTQDDESKDYINISTPNPPNNAHNDDATLSLDYYSSPEKVTSQKRNISPSSRPLERPSTSTKKPLIEPSNVEQIATKRKKK